MSLDSPPNVVDAPTGRRWRTPGLEVECVRVERHLATAGHGHDRAHLCIVLEGTLVERERKREVEMVAGSLRVSPPGDEHRLRFGPTGARCLLLLLEPDLIATAAPAERTFLGGGPIETGIARLRAELAKPARAVSPLEIEWTALELLARATLGTSCSGGPPAWLARVREALRETREPLDAGRLGSIAGRHPVYVARAFRRWFGTSPADFARSARLERARRDLLGSDGSIAGVAHRRGFADQAHLSRWVRRRIGATPGELRRGESFGLEVSSVQDPVRLAR